LLILALDYMSDGLAFQRIDGYPGITPAIHWADHVL
jgi:hypothetical protein